MKPSLKTQLKLLLLLLIVMILLKIHDFCAMTFVKNNRVAPVSNKLDLEQTAYKRLTSQEILELREKSRAKLADVKYYVKVTFVWFRVASVIAVACDVIFRK